MIAAAFVAHARALLARELERRHALLDSLPATSRTAVEQTAQRTLTAMTAAMLEDANREPAIAAALESIYGVPSRPTLAPAAARAD
jgi:hypothetical protein